MSLNIENDSDKRERAVTAVTEDGIMIHADNLVLACGPWTNSVLEMAGLPRLNLKIWQVQWAHYEVDPVVAASIPQAFHFRKESNIDGGLYYIFPASATETLSKDGKAYVKIGVDFPTKDDVKDMDVFGYEMLEKFLRLMDE